MKKELELCRPCAELMKEAFRVTTVREERSRNGKCANCRKKGFTEIFIVEGKQ